MGFTVDYGRNKPSPLVPREPAPPRCGGALPRSQDRGAIRSEKGRDFP
jgi:hypothetical protein